MKAAGVTQQTALYLATKTVPMRSYLRTAICLAFIFTSCVEKGTKCSTDINLVSTNTAPTVGESFTLTAQKVSDNDLFDWLGEAVCDFYHRFINPFVYLFCSFSASLQPLFSNIPISWVYIIASGLVCPTILKT